MIRKKKVRKGSIIRVVGYKLACKIWSQMSESDERWPLNLSPSSYKSMVNTNLVVSGLTKWGETYCGSSNILPCVAITGGARYRGWHIVEDFYEVVKY